MLIAEAILRAVGASGSIIADGMVIAYTAPLPASGAAAPQSVNTTADWYISISCVCSVGVFTAQVGSVRLI
jgi:hypothetical protein